MKICSWCICKIASTDNSCPHCGYNGSQKNPSGMLPLGTVVANRYLVGRYLRIDGEGATYLGYDKKEERAVLVKEYLPMTLTIPRIDTLNVIPKQGSEVLFKTTMYDFIDVHENIMRYEKNPCFIHIYNVVHDNGTVYAIKEYVKSKTLVEYLNTVGYLDFNQALNLLMPVFEAVEILHEQNTLHRGISPENILVEVSGKTRLNGFATQALRTGNSELDGNLCVGYAAPEQYSVVNYQNNATDVYGLAAVLFTCITGDVPPSTQERMSEDALALANTYGKGKISQRQAAVIAKALSIDPNNRQKTVKEFLMQLQGEKENKADIKERVVKFAKNNQKLLVGIALVFVVVMAIFIIVFTNSENEIPSESDSISASVSSGAEVYIVPNFIGKEYIEIANDPQYKGIYIFVMEEIFSSYYKAGEISGQEPNIGVEVAPGTTIYLKVSKGEETAEIPPVAGQSLESAAAVLTERGIRYEIVPVFDESMPPNYVKGMDKQAGTKINIAKDKVILYVVQEQEAPLESSASIAEEIPQSEGIE